jgi:DMSO/TMAO reductase YedYZ molybdopterin-dependent catalytic subunit
MAALVFYKPKGSRLTRKRRLRRDYEDREVREGGEREGKRPSADRALNHADPGRNHLRSQCILRALRTLRSSPLIAAFSYNALASPLSANAAFGLEVDLDYPKARTSVTIRDMRHELSRRRFLQSAALIGGGVLAGNPIAIRGDDTITLPFANGERRLVAYPQKRPLILLTARPPQLETPFPVFNEGVITPNDAFFVRYHHANVPTAIDPETFRLTISGKVKNPLKLSVAELKSQFENVEVVAVNQCSGNSRGFSQPRVGGGQLAHGAMGNARWKGVRLKDVLEKAGLEAGAKNIVCDGLDTPAFPQTPDFIKSLEVDHALDGEVLLAFEMNGEPLPMLNGFPLRLVVPRLLRHVLDQAPAPNHRRG